MPIDNTRYDRNLPSTHSEWLTAWIRADVNSNRGCLAFAAGDVVFARRPTGQESLFAKVWNEQLEAVIYVIITHVQFYDFPVDEIIATPPPATNICKHGE